MLYCNSLLAPIWYDGRRLFIYIMGYLDDQGDASCGYIYDSTVLKCVYRMCRTRRENLY